jgi:hypothetical protein
VLTVQVEGTQQASLIQAHVRLYSLQRFNASSVTKNEASIALSFPQKRLTRNSDVEKKGVRANSDVEKKGGGNFPAKTRSQRFSCQANALNSMGFQRMLWGGNSACCGNTAMGTVPILNSGPNFF